MVETGETGETGEAQVAQILSVELLSSPSDGDDTEDGTFLTVFCTRSFTLKVRIRLEFSFRWSKSKSELVNDVGKQFCDSFEIELVRKRQLNGFSKIDPLYAVCRARDRVDFGSFRKMMYGARRRLGGIDLLYSQPVNQFFHQLNATPFSWIRFPSNGGGGDSSYTVEDLQVTKETRIDEKMVICAWDIETYTDSTGFPQYFCPVDKVIYVSLSKTQFASDEFEAR